MNADAPKYRLVSRSLLAELMRRTGRGDRVTGRQLAAEAGIAHGTVGMLLTGAQEIVTLSTAQAIARRIGVDLLVLWIPAERADAATASLRQLKEMA